MKLVAHFLDFRSSFPAAMLLSITLLPCHCPIDYYRFPWHLLGSFFIPHLERLLFREFVFLQESVFCFFFALST